MTQAIAPAPEASAGRADWRSALRTVTQRGYRLLNRLAIWFSLVMVAVLIARFVDGDWGNFRRHAWYHLFVLLWMGAVTYALRSVGSREVLRFWLAGFFPATFIAFVVGEFSEGRLDPGNFQTAGVVPVVEEIAKILPLILWTTLLRPKHRHGTLSDFLLLGFATGAGFAFHEDALYSRLASSGFDDGILGTLFPVFLSTGQFAIAHAGWTALAGVGVGLISLHRRRPVAVIGGLALIVVPIVDHGVVNFRGDGADWLMTLTDDGRRPGWLLLAVVIAVVVHDAMALRWASDRDRLFPSPSFGGDIDAARVGALPVRVSALALRQQYRRRRNATFIDLFAARSRGVSAGDRERVRRELVVARDRVGIEAAAAPAKRIAASPPSSPTAPARSGGQLSRRQIGRLLVGAVAVIALVVWWSSRDDEGPDDAFAFDDPSVPVFSEEPFTPPPEASPTTTFRWAPLDGGPFGPIITEPVLLQWEHTDEGGPSGEASLAIDGDRELYIRGSSIHYQDPDVTAKCSGFGSDDLRCFETSRLDTLALIGWAGSTGLHQIAGTTADTRRIAGRDAECVSISFDADTSQLSCLDAETGVQLLLQNESLSLLGSPLLVKAELVEWGTSSEADFAPVPDLIAALEDA
jgi:RsiW-degrading membrane proteinase PrsW (M82 family)